MNPEEQHFEFIDVQPTHDFVNIENNEQKQDLNNETKNPDDDLPELESDDGLSKLGSYDDFNKLNFDELFSKQTRNKLFDFVDDMDDNQITDARNVIDATLKMITGGGLSCFGDMMKSNDPTLPLEEAIDKEMGKNPMFEFLAPILKKFLITKKKEIDDEVPQLAIESEVPQLTIETEHDNETIDEISI